MLKFKAESYNKTEAKLLQAKSMATILLDNINYKSHGLDEPTISELDSGNLAWAIIDLIDGSLDELYRCEPSKEKKMPNISLDAVNTISLKLGQADAITTLLILDCDANMPVSDDVRSFALGAISDLISDSKKLFREETESGMSILFSTKKIRSSISFVFNR